MGTTWAEAGVVPVAEEEVQARRPSIGPGVRGGRVPCGGDRPGAIQPCPCRIVNGPRGKKHGVVGAGDALGGAGEQRCQQHHQLRLHVPAVPRQVHVWHLPASHPQHGARADHGV